MALPPVTTATATATTTTAAAAAASDEAVFRDYARQQNGLLTRIQEANTLTALGVVKMGKDIQTQERISKTRFILFIGTWIGLLVWVALTVYSLQVRYAFMIRMVEVARARGVYSGPSGLYLAAVREYPIIGPVLLLNTAFAFAAVYAYYTKEYADIMQDPDEGSKYLQAMYQFSYMGYNNSTSGFPNTQTILCKALAIPAKISDRSCIHSCPGPIGKDWSDYAGSAVGMGMQGAFLGEMTGIPGGALIGGIIFGGLGIFLSRQSKEQSACSQGGLCITNQGTINTC
jgi:hypothetical protein